MKDGNRRVALVTGGGKGIGRAISARLLADGFDVVICGRNAPAELPSHGARAATFEACDVRDADAVRAMVDRIIARHGRLDLVVNNAGGSPEADAATAEDLMRSRYTAYAVGDADYLLRTWAPETRPSRVRIDPAQRWLSLEVLASAGGLLDAAGTVEFVASFTV